MKKEFKLVSFDFDGVLIEQVNSWGFLRDFKNIPKGKIDQYKVSLNPREFRNSEHDLFKEARLHYNDFIEAGKNLTLQPLAKEVVRELHANGLKIVINSAAPHIMINQKVKQIGKECFKQVFSMHPLFDYRGYFYDTFLPFETKNFEMDKIQALEFARKYYNDIKKNEVVHIGDGLTDIICFENYYGISYNVHSERVKAASDMHIESLGKLIDILI
ncbi:MAG: HAD-IB family phosphatase [Candidatus Lokiarchaeota archaeon]|nr:HAD-IB family phosphatase [Candidatus Lokiarchaeota archaeon]